MTHLSVPSQAGLSVPFGNNPLGGFSFGYPDKVLGISSVNLIGYWPLWESSGTTADNYEGTAARDGTYSAVSLGRPGIGDGNVCPRFGESNTGHVNIYSSSLNTAFDGDEGSLNAWIKADNANVWTDADAIMVHFHVSNNHQVELWMASGTGEIVMSREGDNTITRHFYDPSASTDWICVGYNWSVAGNDQRYFIDGSLVTNEGVVGAFTGNLSTTLTTIGAQSTSNALFWNGRIAHVALWDTPISDADFASLAEPQ